MPTYEYRCDNCANNFDVVQSFHDEPLTECPTCGSPVRKVFGSVGIVFKGSGFYKTDSRSGSSTSASGDSAVPAAKSDGGSSEPSGSGSDSSTTPASTTPAAGSSDTKGSANGAGGKDGKGDKGGRGKDGKGSSAPATSSPSKGSGRSST